MLVEGKRALVTGSSRGIGRGIAIRIAEQGASKVGITYLAQHEAAEETLAAVRAAGAEGFVVQGDVTKPEEIRRMFERTRQEMGGLDILVSHARGELGLFYEPPETISLAQFEYAFDSQGRAFHLAVREASPLLSDGGRIVAVTCSPSARTGSWQPWAAMGAAKAALESLCHYWAVALAERGITVNAVSPGATEDNVLSRLPAETFDTVRRSHEGGWTPMRRLTTPADVGNAVVLLCSDLAGFVTGQVLHVDGGASVMDPVFPLALQGLG